MSELAALGLVQTKSFLNTADLYDFEPVADAEPVLNYYQSEQIFTVKPDRLQWFLDLLDSSKKIREEEWDMRDESQIEAEINE